MKPKVSACAHTYAYTHAHAYIEYYFVSEHENAGGLQRKLQTNFDLAFVSDTTKMRGALKFYAQVFKRTVRVYGAHCLCLHLALLLVRILSLLL